MEEIGKFLISQYGFIGLATFAMAGVIIYLFKDAKKERAQMRKEHLEERESLQLQHFKERELIQARTDNNFNTIVKITQDNTSVLKGIETLIQSIDRRTE